MIVSGTLQDIEIVWKIVKHLASQPKGGVRLPSGSLLSPRCFQLLGYACLGFAGGFDRLHFLLEMAWDTCAEDELSYRFLKVRHMRFIICGFRCDIWSTRTLRGNSYSLPVLNLVEYQTLKGYDSWMVWETNPLFVLLHESIYTQGGQTNWSADRMRKEHFCSQFDPLEAIQEGTIILV